MRLSVWSLVERSVILTSWQKCSITVPPNDGLTKWLINFASRSSINCVYLLISFSHNIHNKDAVVSGSKTLGLQRWDTHKSQQSDKRADGHTDGQTDNNYLWLLPLLPSPFSLKIFPPLLEGHIFLCELAHERETKCWIQQRSGIAKRKYKTYNMWIPYLQNLVIQQKRTP